MSTSKDKIENCEVNDDRLMIEPSDWELLEEIQDKKQKGSLDQDISDLYLFADDRQSSSQGKIEGKMKDNDDESNESASMKDSERLSLKDKPPRKFKIKRKFATNEELAMHKVSSNSDNKGESRRQKHDSKEKRESKFISEGDPKEYSLEGKEYSEKQANVDDMALNEIQKCDVCSAIFNGQAAMIEHLQSLSHSLKQAKSLLNKAVHEKNITLADLGESNESLDNYSLKELKNIAQRLCQDGGGQPYRQPYRSNFQNYRNFNPRGNVPFCNICNIEFDNQAAYVRHTSSFKHNMMLKNIRDKPTFPSQHHYSYVNPYHQQFTRYKGYDNTFENVPESGRHWTGGYTSKDYVSSRISKSPEDYPKGNEQNWSYNKRSKSRSSSNDRSQSRSPKRSKSHSQSPVRPRHYKELLNEEKSFVKDHSQSPPQNSDSEKSQSPVHSKSRNKKSKMLVKHIDKTKSVSRSPGTSDSHVKLILKSKPEFDSNEKIHTKTKLEKKIQKKEKISDKDEAKVKLKHKKSKLQSYEKVEKGTSKHSKHSKKLQMQKASSMSASQSWSSSSASNSRSSSPEIGTQNRSRSASPILSKVKESDKKSKIVVEAVKHFKTYEKNLVGKAKSGLDSNTRSISRSPPRLHSELKSVERSSSRSPPQLQSVLTLRSHMNSSHRSQSLSRSPEKSWSESESPKRQRSFSKSPPGPHSWSPEKNITESANLESQISEELLYSKSSYKKKSSKSKLSDPQESVQKFEHPSLQMKSSFPHIKSYLAKGNSKKGIFAEEPIEWEQNITDNLVGYPKQVQKKKLLHSEEIPSEAMGSNSFFSNSSEKFEDKFSVDQSLEIRHKTVPEHPLDFLTKQATLVSQKQGKVELDVTKFSDSDLETLLQSQVHSNVSQEYQQFLSVVAKLRAQSLSQHQAKESFSTDKSEYKMQSPLATSLATKSYPLDSELLLNENIKVNLIQKSPLCFEKTPVMHSWSKSPESNKSVNSPPASPRRKRSHSKTSYSSITDKNDNLEKMVLSDKSVLETQGLDQEQSTTSNLKSKTDKVINPNDSVKGSATDKSKKSKRKYSSSRSRSSSSSSSSSASSSPSSTPPRKKSKRPKKQTHSRSRSRSRSRSYSRSPSSDKYPKAYKREDQSKYKKSGNQDWGHRNNWRNYNDGYNSQYNNNNNNWKNNWNMRGRVNRYYNNRQNYWNYSKSPYYNNQQQQYNRNYRQGNYKQNYQKYSQSSHSSHSKSHSKKKHRSHSRSSSRSRSYSRSRSRSRSHSRSRSRSHTRSYSRSRSPHSRNVTRSVISKTSHSKTDAEISANVKSSTSDYKKSNSPTRSGSRSPVRSGRKKSRFHSSSRSHSRSPYEKHEFSEQLKKDDENENNREFENKENKDGNELKNKNGNEDENKVSEIEENANKEKSSADENGECSKNEDRNKTNTETETDDKVKELVPYSPLSSSSSSSCSSCSSDSCDSHSSCSKEQSRSAKATLKENEVVETALTISEPCLPVEQTCGNEISEENVSTVIDDKLTESENISEAIADATVNSDSLTDTDSKQKPTSNQFLPRSLIFTKQTQRTETPKVNSVSQVFQSHQLENKKKISIVLSSSKVNTKNSNENDDSLKLDVSSFSESFTENLPNYKSFETMIIDNQIMESHEVSENEQINENQELTENQQIIENQQNSENLQGSDNQKISEYQEICKSQQVIENQQINENQNNENQLVENQQIDEEEVNDIPQINEKLQISENQQITDVSLSLSEDMENISVNMDAIPSSESTTELNKISEKNNNLDATKSELSGEAKRTISTDVKQPLIPTPKVSKYSHQYCDICYILLIPTVADNHPNSSVHKQKLHTKETVFKNPELLRTVCEICWTMFGSAEDLKKHKHSFVHENTEKTKAYVEKALGIVFPVINIDYVYSHQGFVSKINASELDIVKNRLTESLPAESNKLKADNDSSISEGSKTTGLASPPRGILNFCDTCFLILNSSVADAHNDCLSHLEKVKVKEFLQENNEYKNYICSTCFIVTDNPEKLQIHMTSESHNAILHSIQYIEEEFGLQEGSLIEQNEKQLFGSGPTQFPSSNQNVVMKSNQMYYSPETYCVLCFTYLSTETSQTHYQSECHLAKKRVKETFIEDLSLRKLICDVCCIMASTEKDLIIHMTSKEHEIVANSKKSCIKMFGFTEEQLSILARNPSAMNQYLAAMNYYASPENQYQLQAFYQYMMQQGMDASWLSHYYYNPSAYMEYLNSYYAAYADPNYMWPSSYYPTGVNPTDSTAEVQPSSDVTATSQPIQSGNIPLVENPIPNSTPSNIPTASIPPTSTVPTVSDNQSVGLPTDAVNVTTGVTLPINSQSIGLLPPQVSTLPLQPGQSLQSDSTQQDVPFPRSLPPVQGDTTSQSQENVSLRPGSSFPGATGGILPRPEGLFPCPPEGLFSRRPDGLLPRPGGLLPCPPGTFFPQAAKNIFGLPPGGVLPQSENKPPLSSEILQVMNSHFANISPSDKNDPLKKPLLPFPQLTANDAEKEISNSGMRPPPQENIDLNTGQVQDKFIPPNMKIPDNDPNWEKREPPPFPQRIEERGHCMTEPGNVNWQDDPHFDMRKNSHPVADKLFDQKQDDFRRFGSNSFDRKFDEMKRFGPPDEMKRFGPPDEMKRFVPPDEMKRFVPPDEMKRFGPPDEMKRFGPPEEMKRFGPPEEMKRFGPPEEMKRFGPPEEMKRFGPPDEMKRFGPPDEMKRFRPPDEMKRFGPPDEMKRFGPPDEMKRFGPPDEMKRFGPPDEMKRFGPPDEMKRFGPPDEMRRFGQPAPNEDEMKRFGSQNFFDGKSDEFRRFGFRSGFDGNPDKTRSFGQPQQPHVFDGKPNEPRFGTPFDGHPNEPRFGLQKPFEGNPNEPRRFGHPDSFEGKPDEMRRFGAPNPHSDNDFPTKWNWEENKFRRDDNSPFPQNERNFFHDSDLRLELRPPGDNPDFQRENDRDDRSFFPNERNPRPLLSPRSRFQEERMHPARMQEDRDRNERLRDDRPRDNIRARNKSQDKRRGDRLREDNFQGEIRDEFRENLNDDEHFDSFPPESGRGRRRGFAFKPENRRRMSSPQRRRGRDDPNFPAEERFGSNRDAKWR